MCVHIMMKHVLPWGWWWRQWR